MLTQFLKSIAAGILTFMAGWFILALWDIIPMSFEIFIKVIITFFIMFLLFVFVDLLVFGGKYFTNHKK